MIGIDGKTGHQKFLADMYNDSFTIDIIDQTYRFRVPMIEPDEEKRVRIGNQLDSHLIYRH